uniref:Transcription initiation factor IIF subunit alpha n=1 Tax=Fopius arisanus TaxID=64838 RepID=A0A0C9QRU5_9HYME
MMRMEMKRMPSLLRVGKKARSSKKDKDLKISEMDEWMDSDDDDSESDEEKEKKASDDEADGSKKKKKGKAPQKKKKKNTSDDEALEESDDGDEEGRECDYISDSTDSEAEAESNKIKSVAEEDALRKLLASDEEDEDEQKDKTEKEDDSENDENKDKDEKDKGKDGDKRKDKDKKKKKKQSAKKKDTAKKNGKDSSSDFSSDSDTDSDAHQKDKKDNKVNSAQSSRSATPVPGPSTNDNLKRKTTSSPDISQSKKLKLDNFNSAPSSSYIPGLSESGITEDAVRRYLTRKPMTTTELLQKFKSKKTGLKSDDLVNVMTLILKKIKPTQQIVKKKMYLSIKPQPH